MKGCRKNESGMMIVEATIVFPVMFLVIFLMLFAGNAYLQKCRVDSIVNRLAIQGASYCADHMLEGIENGAVPNFKNVDIQPYRYIFGEMGEIEANIDKKINAEISKLSTGLFFGMKPTSVEIVTKYNNGFIYSTFSIDVRYNVQIPIRLLGASDYISLKYASHADMPASDIQEFIRNVNMVEDYMQRSGVTSFIEDLCDKVKGWFGS